jgi:hypothetical protein
METGNRDMLNGLFPPLQPDDPGDTMPLSEKKSRTTWRLPDEHLSDLPSETQNVVTPDGSFTGKEDPAREKKADGPPRQNSAAGKGTGAGKSILPANPAGTVGKDAGEKDGLYLYALAELPGDIPVGMHGIEGENVFIIPFRNISAIVHACPLTPYTSDDEDIITRWVIMHQDVLDRLLNVGIPLIPFSFDTIIRPDGEKESSEVLVLWLSDEYDKFTGTFDKIRGKKEYGIQVFCTTAKIRDALMESNKKIKAFYEEITTSGPGKEYLLRQKIEKELKTATDAEIAGLVAGITDKIRMYCDEIKPGTPKKGQDTVQVMIMNCSCLVSDENYPKLGGVLEEIEKEWGLPIRFTGPWAVYSFV